MARCPVHEDDKASLSIGRQDGKILVHCFTGCPVEDVLRAKNLTMKDLFVSSNGQHASPIIATYDYRDLTGTLRYRKQRTADKNFRFERPDGNRGWIRRKEQNNGQPVMHGVERLLYRLNELRERSAEASTATFRVWIVEGEKDADRLWVLGLPATTNDSGASEDARKPKWTDAETLAARLAGGRLSGRPPKTATSNLLAGLAACGLCGGGLVVETSPKKRGRVPEYLCYRHRSNGTCTNAVRMPVADLNEAVLQAVEEHALTPEAIEMVIHLSERDDVTELQGKLTREEKDITKRVARLVAAIETGGDAASLVAKVRDLEARQRAIGVEMACLRPVPRLAPAVVESRLAEWRRLLRASTTQGRTVLQRILRGRLTFTPRRNPISDAIDGYDFTGPTRFDKLFTGIAVETQGWAKAYAGDRRGCEDIGPEDTFEGDYGRLLDRAYQKSVKVVASLTIPSWNQIAGFLESMRQLRDSSGFAA